jgi:hypothetical protein
MPGDRSQAVAISIRFRDQSHQRSGRPKGRSQLSNVLRKRPQIDLNPDPRVCIHAGILPGPC